MTGLINPFASFEVSDVWRDGHQAIDYRTPVGYAFGAPGDGVYIRRPDEFARDAFGRIRPGQAGINGDLVLPNGARIRFCHLDRHIAKNGSRVKQGAVLAETGNTGYSSGPHMHTTGFHPDGTRWNWTLTAQPAGVDSNPFPEEDDMTPEQASQLNSVFNAIFRGGKSMPDDEKSLAQSVAEIQDKLAPIIRTSGPVSLRQEVADSKTGVIQLTAQVAALSEVVKQLAAGGGKPIDLAAIEAAAERGAQDALASLVLVQAPTD